MTNRLTYANIWSEGGTAIDPDLDTDSPSYVEDKYSNVGWVSEKPPEEWQNFLSQITDAKIVAMIYDGVPEKDTSVNYPDGAVYKDSGNICVVESGVAKPIVEIRGKEFSAIVEDLQTKISTHTTADNPHNDSVDTLLDKSYVKTDVDKFFGSVTDPRTIPYHKAQVGGAVHGETPAQVGALPEGGGTFTGPVILSKGAKLSDNPVQSVDLSNSTGLFELVNGSVSFGVDGNGKCWVRTSSGSFEVMTKNNYAEFQIRWNNLFALPLPMLDMKFCKSLSDADSVGVWTILTTGNPSFSPNGGGLKVDDNTITFQNFNVPTSCDIYVVGRDSNGSRITSLSAGAPSANYISMETLLKNVGMSNAVYVERIAVFERLSSYQKSMLVR